jgi:hypothetical protein
MILFRKLKEQGECSFTHFFIETETEDEKGNDLGSQ